AQTDYVASEAALKTSVADLNRAKSDLERSKLDYDRAIGLYKAQLIPKSEFDMRKSNWEMAEASLAQTQARVAQAKAQQDSAGRRINQNKANLTRASDVLSKTIYSAPFDGIVTNLPVREGETVVIGIQNAQGSTLMTIADMSVITAEVKVDETDIVNVMLGQPADVTIDAIPKKIFHGKVTEIGNNAIVRSSGLSTSQQTTASEEAKDFKVVVTLSDAPQDLRPGLSTTAKVTTATRANALSVPIQALTLRTKDQIDAQNNPPGSVHAEEPTAKEVSSNSKRDDEFQGVFATRKKKAMFGPVATGITGTTDIEVLDGLKEGDEVITGSYKVLR